MRSFALFLCASSITSVSYAGPGDPTLPRWTETTTLAPPKAQPTPPKAPPQTGARSTNEKSAPVEEEIIVADAGDWGMFFRFGGLANMATTGNTRNINELLLTQAGLKKVISPSLHIPIYFGAGLRWEKRDTAGEISPDPETDWGFDFGVALEYHFRMWRRISPFIGANLGFGYSNPTGNNNSVFGIGLGPLMGVEYYIADRVSLSAQYFFVFQIERQFDDQTAIGLQTLSGGAMNLTFYF